MVFFQIYSTPLEMLRMQEMAPFTPELPRLPRTPRLKGLASLAFPRFARSLSEVPKTFWTKGPKLSGLLWSSVLKTIFSSRNTGHTHVTMYLA